MPSTPPTACATWPSSPTSCAARSPWPTSPPRCSSSRQLETVGPLHVAGADALSRLEFARLVCRRHGRDPDGAARRAGGPRSAQAHRPRLLAGARPAARAPARRARGPGAVRAVVVGAGVVGPHHRRAPARGGHRRGRRRARGAAGHDLRRGRGALVPLPRAAGRARHGVVGGRPTRRWPRLADVPGSGVRMRAGTELLAPDAPDPWWRDAVPGLERTREGLRFVAPVVDMSVHLPWLVRAPARARRHGRAP